MPSRKKSPKKFKAEAIHPTDWNKDGLKEHLRQMQGKRILVIGDVGVDRYTVGSVERISPEAPVPIVLVQSEQFKLGLAANVADNIHVLGGTPLLVGVVGKDRSAVDFKKLLRDSRISASHLVEDATRRTVMKERVVSDRQQLLRVDYESQHAIAAAIETQLLKRVSALLPGCDAVIIEDYAKGLLSKELMAKIVRKCKQAGKLVAIDPNAKTPVGHYKGGWVLTPNTREAEMLSGVSIRDEESLNDAGKKILAETGARHVVITRGKDGMAIFTKGSSRVSLIPTYAREVYDVSGAGDTVISVLTLALSSGASIEEASVLGNLAAGVEVSKRGTATVTPEEVLVALEFFGTIAV